MKIAQIVGERNPRSYAYEFQAENDWLGLDADLLHWTKGLRPVQV